MEQKTTDKPSSVSNKGIWYVLAVVLLLLFIFGLASNKKKEETNVTSGTPISPVPVRTQTGAYTFSAGAASTGGQVTASVGTVKNVPLTMDSQGHQVVGYNLIIQYDPSVISIGKISSSLPDFSVNQSEIHKGYVVIDGNKSPQVNTASVFNNTPILSVPVTVHSAGTYSLRLIEKNDKDESKFFDENVAPYYPVGGVVTIESK